MRTALHKTVIAASLALMGMTAFAQTTSTGSSDPYNNTQTTQTINPAPAQASTPADKIITQFSPYLGEENSTNLVNGLRTGSEITLVDTGSSSSTGGSVTFTSPTRPTGYGNIRIALSLAEAQLRSQNVTEPTAEQLQTVLMGEMSGSTATAQTSSQTQGILQMRASGMGWGKIANTMGFKLGPVMSGRVPASTVTTDATSTTDSVTTTSSATSAGGSTITTASGRPQGGNSAHGSGTNRGDGAGAGSTGIVTATGAPAGGGNGRNYRAYTAGGNANGHAAVPGSGNTSSSSAVSAQGAGRGVGHAYGRSK